MSFDHLIEIYIKTSDIRSLLFLLEKQVGNLMLDTALSDGCIEIYESGNIRIIIRPNIEGTGFCSIELLGSDLPWISNREFAHFVASAGNVVRFDFTDPRDPEVPLAVEVDSVGSERVVMWELQS